MSTDMNAAQHRVCSLSGLARGLRHLSLLFLVFCFRRLISFSFPTGREETPRLCKVPRGLVAIVDLSIYRTIVLTFLI